MRPLRNMLFVLLPGWLSIPVAAQTFNVRSDPHGLMLQEVAFSCQENVQGQYIVIAGAPFYDSAYYYSSVVTSLLLDQSGAVIHVDRVIHPEHATYPGGPNNLTRCNNGFVTGGNTLRSDSLGNNLRDVALYFFDEAGTVQGLVTLPQSGAWIGRQAKPTPDGGYVICGDAEGDPFVIKTDANGQEQWTQRYGGPFTDYALSISNRPGGGYYFGGSARIVANNIEHWVMALNDTGGVIWDRKWGTQYDDSNISLITGGNGGPIIVTTKAHGPTIGTHYLAELSAVDGSTLWEREYGPVCTSCKGFTVKEVPDGSGLISAGVMRSPTVLNQGTLLRTTNDGDSLWMRMYQYSDEFIDNGRGWFWDVVSTSDGGFLACGSAQGVALADTLLYSQDIWVVKVDEHGCLEPGCHLITGMETQITNLREALKVWPNPVAQGGTAQVEVQLQEGFVVQGALQLTVTDAAGRLVHEEVLGPGGHRERSEANRTSLIRAQWPSGLYHLHLHDATRWLAGAKLVVE